MTEAELRAFVEHISYEVKMLLMADLHLLREGSAPRDPQNLDEWTVHNALLESHTVHIRVLYAFFFQPRRYPDDAIASDYAPTWESRRPKPSPTLQRAPAKVNKEIVHLSYGRLLGKTVWPFWALTHELVEALNSWLPETPAYVSDHLLEYIRDYLVQVKRVSDT